MGTVLLMTIGIDRASAWHPEFTFGDRVRLVRRDCGKTQAEMADILGAKRVTYSAWEAGRGPEDILAIAKRIQLATGVSASWLLGLDTEKAPPPDGGGAQVEPSVRHQGLEPRTRCFGVVAGQDLEYLEELPRVA